MYSKWSDKNVRLYVLIWEDFMETAVPEGCDIHHLDQNRNNNDILNLVCLTRKEHHRWHNTHRTKEQKNNISKGKKGKKWTEENKKKLSDIKKGKTWRIENGKRKWYEKDITRDS